MTARTSIAYAMMANDIREYRDHYDRLCKRILSEKSVLGWILHECLDEFRSVEPAEIAERFIVGSPEVGTVAVDADAASISRIEELNAEDVSIDEGTIWYDIRFRAIVPNTGEQIGMIVNIEAQGDFYPGYPLLKRAIYYCGRMISSQRGRVFNGSDYEKVQKVCSIWICPNPPAMLRNTVTRWSMTEQHLVGMAQLNRRDYDLIEVVLVCPDGDRQQEGDGILRLLGTLLVSQRSVEEREAIIRNEFGIPVSEQLSERMSEMGSWLSKGLEDKAYERGFEAGTADGIKLGIEQGFEQGIEQGIEQGKMHERELLSQLAAALEAVGRSEELAQALLHTEVLDRLSEEFGIGQN